MNYKQTNILTDKRKEKTMKEFIKKGLSTLPVVNEMLLCLWLAYEVAQRLNNWRKKKSSTDKDPDEESGKE